MVTVQIQNAFEVLAPLSLHYILYFLQAWCLWKKKWNHVKS